MNGHKMTELNVEHLHGQRFGNGRYTLVEPAANKTNMSIVYKARDNNTGQTVAIKLLLPEHARNEPIRQRFALEAQVSYGLQHPNVVATIDYSLREENGIPAYLVMKWLPGDSLDNRIKTHLSTDVPTALCAKRCTTRKVGVRWTYHQTNRSPRHQA